MAKSSKSTATKAHGPKTNRFHGYSKCMRLAMANSGFLNKHTDREAFLQSANAKGEKPTRFMGMFITQK